MWLKTRHWKPSKWFLKTIYLKILAKWDFGFVYKFGEIIILNLDDPPSERSCF